MCDHITRHHIKITNLNSSTTDNDREETKLTVEYDFKIKKKKKKEIFLRLWQIARSKYE